MGCIIFTGIMGLVLFKQKEVPDVDWDKSFNFNNDQPYGYSLFSDLLKEKYKPKNVSLISNMSLDSLESQSNLFVIVGKNLRFDQEQLMLIDSILQFDSQLLFISPAVTLNYPVTENYNYLGATHLDSFVTITAADSLSNFSFDHAFYSQDFEEAKNYSYSHQRFYDGEDSIITEILLLNDSLLICSSLKSYDDRLVVHSVPQLFTNSAALQNGFLEHFNYLFNRFPAEHVYIGSGNSLFPKSALAESPIKYILANRGLKWAYYLLLATGLLFVIFGGKRKQRIIKTIAPNKNTSIDFVKTLSRLFQKQNKNEKLVKRMEDVFYHKVYKKYFIKKKQKDFVNALSQKSQIESEEIEKILLQFENLDMYEFYSDEKLFAVYNKLESFYKNAK